MAQAKQANTPIIAMRGAGYYSANTAGAKTVIDRAGDLVLEALATLPIAATGPALHIADYGAADGGTSLDMMRRLVAAIRDRAPGREIAITYTDLPHNDFSAMFRLLHGMGPVPDPVPLAREANVLTFASGTSFHRRILPAGSLHLGFSATAMHWLSRMPGPISGAVQAVGASGAERAAFCEQGRIDWETILLHRATELAPGGKLVMANFCIDPEGRYLGNTGGVNMFASFARHWAALAGSGAISEAEMHAATLQQYYRSVEEFCAPLNDPNSPVSKAGLRLGHVSTRVTACPYAADFAVHGDAARFAKSYLPTLRSWTESTFMSALDAARPPAERQAIIDRFYGNYEAEVAAKPAGHAMDYVHCFMSIEKVNS